MSEPLIHESSLVEAGVYLGSGVKIWHFCHLDKGSYISDDTVLGQNVYIGKDVHIGKGCRIQNNVSVYSGVELEDYVFLGPSCVFTNVKTPRAFSLVGPSGFSKTLVKTGASIGANATIVCPRIIGAYSLVGAGSLVSKDVRDYELVYGNPAKHQGWVCNCGCKLEEDLHCKSCGANYIKTSSGLVPQTQEG